MIEKFKKLRSLLIVDIFNNKETTLGLSIIHNKDRLIKAPLLNLRDILRHFSRTDSKSKSFLSLNDQRVFSQVNVF